MRDDYGRIGMAEAVNMLVASKGSTVKGVRKAIIAALIEEKLVACCDSYWIDSIPQLSGEERCRRDLAPWDSAVPADFWALDHAHHYEWNPNGGEVPTGSWGCWHGHGKSLFSTEKVLSGATASFRYEDFAELAYMGSKPVTLTWSAIGVSLHRLDIERLGESGSINALIRRAERRPSIRWGNVKKSDSMRVIARCCAQFLTIADQMELAANPARLLQSFQGTVSSVSEEAAVSDKVMRGFANLVAEEANKLALLGQSFAPID